MKTRNREINIFNLSMLDVISGAMAAFLIIMVVLFPFYNKTSIDFEQIIANLRSQNAALTEQLQNAQTRAESAQQEAEQQRQQAESAQQEAERQRQQAESAQQEAEQQRQRAESAQQEADRQRQRAEGLAEKLAKTFLVIYIRWNTRDDIDLHVIDPSGKHFYFSEKTYPNHPGELSEDTTNGPGNEVWEVRDAPPGDYKVYAELFAVKGSSSPNVTVQGRVFHRDGSEGFREIRLTREKERKLIATLRVDQQGNVTLQ